MYPASYYRPLTPAASFAEAPEHSVHYSNWTSHLDPNRFVWQFPEAGPPVSNDEDIVHKIEHYINNYSGFPTGMRFLVILEHAGERSPIIRSFFDEIIEENKQRGLETGIIMLNDAGSVSFKTYDTDGHNTIPEVSPWRFHLKIRLPNDGISTKMIYSGIEPLEVAGVVPKAIATSPGSVQPKTSIPLTIHPQPSPAPHPVAHNPYSFKASYTPKAASQPSPMPQSVVKNPYRSKQQPVSHAPSPSPKTTAAIPLPKATFTQYDGWISHFDPDRFVWQDPQAGPPVANDIEIVQKIEQYINNYPGLPRDTRFLVILETAGGRSPITRKYYDEIIEENKQRGVKTGIIMLNTSGSATLKTYDTDGLNPIPEVHPWRFHLRIGLPNDGMSFKWIFYGIAPLEVSGVVPKAIIA